jgi:hypothetical protein
MFVSFKHLKSKFMGTQELIQDSTYYEPLLESFMGRGSQKGWEFKRLRREGMYAMYEKVSEEGCKVYEVIRVRKDKGGVSVIGGVEVVFRAKEYYPSDNYFGTDGWSYGSLSDAEHRFRLLTA